MKYFVPINLETIEKNPKAGQVVTAAIGAMVSFECTQMPDFLIDGVNCMVETKHDLKRGAIYTGLIEDFESLKDRLLNYKKDNFSFKIIEEAKRLDYTIAPYKFDYEIIEIVCEGCKQTISSDELIHGEAFGHYSGNVCPNCGEFDCCQLEFETIEDALKRKESK